MFLIMNTFDKSHIGNRLTDFTNKVYQSAHFLQFYSIGICNRSEELNQRPAFSATGRCCVSKTESQWASEGSSWINSADLPGFSFYLCLTREEFPVALLKFIDLEGRPRLLNTQDQGEGVGLRAANLWAGCYHVTLPDLSCRKQCNCLQYSEPIFVETQRDLWEFESLQHIIQADRTTVQL